MEAKIATPAARNDILFYIENIRLNLVFPSRFEPLVLERLPVGAALSLLTKKYQEDGEHNGFIQDMSDMLKDLDEQSQEMISRQSVSWLKGWLRIDTEV